MKITSILDVGAGWGKYGLLCREYFDGWEGAPLHNKKAWKVRIDGIEADRSYRWPLHEIVYDNIVYEDVFEVLESVGTYDVILMIDVLEHLDINEGRKVV